jgi:hypothetical protein
VEDFLKVFKASAYASETPTDMKEEEGDEEEIEQQDQSKEIEETIGQGVNSFWDVSYNLLGEEEEV